MLLLYPEYEDINLAGVLLTDFHQICKRICPRWKMKKKIKLIFWVLIPIRIRIRIQNVYVVSEDCQILIWI